MRNSRMQNAEPVSRRDENSRMSKSQKGGKKQLMISLNFIKDPNEQKKMQELNCQQVQDELEQKEGGADNYSRATKKIIEFFGGQINNPDLFNQLLNDYLMKNRDNE